MNASLTQNECLLCVAPALTPVEIPQLRDATELNSDGVGVIKLDDVTTSTTKHNRIYQFFSERDLINDDSTFCSLILSAIDFQCHVFPFEKLLLNVRLCP